MLTYLLALITVKFWDPDSLFRALFTIPRPISFRCLEGPRNRSRNAVIMASDGLLAALGIPGLYSHLRVASLVPINTLLVAGKEKNSNKKKMQSVNSRFLWISLTKTAVIEKQFLTLL